jgi:hypothetical protein
MVTATEGHRGKDGNINLIYVIYALYDRSTMFFSMVAKPDFKSGFETDSNPDLTKNYDPV